MTSYRNNVTTFLIAALPTALFPLVLKVLGTQKFRTGWPLVRSVRTRRPLRDSIMALIFLTSRRTTAIVKKWVTCPTAPAFDPCPARSLHAADSAPFDSNVPAAYARKRDDAKHSSSPPCDGFAAGQGCRFSISGGSNMAVRCPKPQMQAPRPVDQPAPSFDPPRIFVAPPAAGNWFAALPKRTLDQAHDTRWRSCLISILVRALGLCFATGAFCGKKRRIDAEALTLYDRATHWNFQAQGQWHAADACTVSIFACCYDVGKYFLCLLASPNSTGW